MRRAIVLGVGLAALAAVGTGVAVFAFQKRDARRGVVITPENVELGDVEYGQQRELEFTIENRGDSTATLREPVFNCGCFYATSHPSVSLRPGEKTKFNVQMDSWKTDPRSFHKEMDVVFMAEEGAGKLAVQLTGEVLNYFNIDKEKIELGAVDAAKGSPAQRFQVRDGPGFSARVEQATPKDDRFSAEIVPAANGSDVVVTFRPSPASAKGKVQVRIDVKVSVTGHGRAPLTRNRTLWVTADVR